MKQSETNLMPKNAQKFYCEKCDFTCSKKSNYKNHLLTRKHKMKQFETNLVPKNADYFCEICESVFNSRTTLWRHKKKCIISEIVAEPVKKDSDKIEFCKELVPLLKDMLVEVAPVLQPNSITTTNNNTTNNNINNNNFNINVFLNEQCKDAMNITDFIESIQFTLQDMTSIGKDGQTKGMTNLLIEKLNGLDLFERPVHCSDIKKEIIYVKDQNIWKEEEKEKPKLKHALDQLTKKSIEVLPEINQDPDDYVQTVNELLKEPRQDKKIISKLAKEICI
jgi:hypothetical protein